MARPHEEALQRTTDKYLTKLRQRKRKRKADITSGAKQKRLLALAQGKMWQDRPLNEKEQAALDGFKVYISKAEAEKRGEPWRVGARLELYRQQKENLSALSQQTRMLSENTKADVQEAIAARRERALIAAVAHGSMDPSMLDEGQTITFPPNVIEAILLNKNNEEAIAECVKSLCLDNLGQLTALMKSKDEKIRLKAFELVFKHVFGDKVKAANVVPGQNPGSFGVQINFISEKGEKKTLEVTSNERK